MRRAGSSRRPTRTTRASSSSTSSTPRSLARAPLVRSTCRMPTSSWAILGRAGRAGQCSPAPRARGRRRGRPRVRLVRGLVSRASADPDLQRFADRVLPRETPRGLDAEPRCGRVQLRRHALRRGAADDIGPGERTVQPGGVAKPLGHGDVRRRARVPARRSRHSGAPRSCRRPHPRAHARSLRARDERADDVVRGPEGHAQLDERVGDRGRGRVARRPRPRASAPRPRRASRRPARPSRAAMTSSTASAVEERRLVLLEVALVAGGQALEQRQRPRRGARSPARSGRAPARPGRGCACWASSTSRSRRRRTGAGSRSAGCDHHTSSSARRDRWTIASAAAASASTTKSRSPDGVDRVARDAARTRAPRPPPRGRARNPAPARAPGAEGRDVRPSQGIREPAPVAFEHLDIREEVMREEHRLGRLDVRVAGHDRRRVARAQRSRAPARARRSPHRARPARRCSQSRRSVATWSLRERPVWSLPATGPMRARERHLEVEVDVLERRVPRDRTGPDVRLERAQARRPELSASSSVSRPARRSPPTWAREPGDVVERQLLRRPRWSARSRPRRVGLGAEAAAPGLHAGHVATALS